MNTEAQNTADFLASVAKVPGLLVFRNNCGALRGENGRTVFFGVGGPSAGTRKGLGGSDFIGIWQGLFVAFEIKADKDNTEPERLERQENFIQRIVANGGRAGFVRRGKDVTEILAGRGCVRLKDYQFTTYENT